MSTPEDTPPSDPATGSVPEALAPDPMPGSAHATAPEPDARWNLLSEQFARAYLQDRRGERRWRVFFRLAWLLLVMVIAYAVFAARVQSSAPSGPHTALIEVRGEIADGAPASAENLVAGLRSAFEDEGAQAVVLRINSPGGSPVQAGIIYDEIGRLRAKYKKPVYAVVEESCASAAYYIASASDRIFVDKASIVGSI
ncbi:MAG: S49 family peptidase, partial [Burkholderiaceae bacterium]